MRAKFVRGEDPRKMMRIGETALEKDRIRSLDWQMEEDFLEDVLTRDYGFEEYMGFKILVYTPNFVKKWFAITSKPKGGRGSGFRIGSSSGAASESKESALKDIKAKIRKRLKDLGQISERLDFERGMDPKDSMELGDVEGREKKRKKAEFAIRRDEIYDAAKKLALKFSKRGHSLRISTSDEISFYKVTLRTKKMNTYTLEVTYFAPRYELNIITSRGREERLAFEKVDTLVKQVEFYEKHSNLI